MSVATLQMKAPAINNGLFIRLPRSFRKTEVDGSRITGKTVDVAGKIFSCSDEVAGRACHTSQQQLADELGCTTTTVNKAVAFLKAGGLISSTRTQKGTDYIFTGVQKGKLYDIIPQALREAEFCIGGKFRKLITSERSIVSAIYTYTGAKKVFLSLNKLARDLNLSKKTVQRAIDVLIDVKILYREKVGVNGKQGSVYTIHRDVYDLFKQCKKKKAKPENVAPLPKEIQAVNARTDRERYYARLREQAQGKADKLLEVAESSIEFKECTRELSKMELALAKAEVYAPNTLPALQERQRELQTKRARALRRLGLTEEMLVVQYRCEKCQDTGYLLDSGRGCDCYNYRI